jgi:hypothetical protein
VRDFGVSSDDLKNLTVSALLAKLLAGTKDSAVQSLMRAAQKMAKDSGVSEVIAGTLLNDRKSVEA